MGTNNTALVIGAGGGLGRALCDQWLQDDNIDTVIAISRQPEQESDSPPGIQWIQSDYSELSIDEVCKRIKTHAGTLTRVCICNGLLHNDHIRPEKRIEDIRIQALQEVFSVNAFIPII